MFDGEKQGEVGSSVETLPPKGIGPSLLRRSYGLELFKVALVAGVVGFPPTKENYLLRRQFDGELFNVTGPNKSGPRHRR